MEYADGGDLQVNFKINLESSQRKKKTCFYISTFRLNNEEYISRVQSNEI